MRSEFAATAPTRAPAAEQRLWRKLLRAAATVTMAEELVAAWYCAVDPDTPAHVRATLLAALAFFVVPTPAMRGALVAIGITGRFVTIEVLVRTVAQHITPKHRTRVSRLLDKLLRSSSRRDGSAWAGAGA